MKTVAIIQARMTSQRLPGKVLLALGGATVIDQVIRRVRSARGVDEVVVATTSRASDDALAAAVHATGTQVFRGDEADVLGRYAGAARAAHADVVVRVTSDCPLFDGEVLATMIATHARAIAAGDLDYASNTIVRTYPRGLDAEMFSRAVLEEAAAHAASSSEREHVTPYMREPGRFRTANVSREGSSLAALRWTLDTDDDYRFLTAVFDALGPHGGAFSTGDVLALLEARPQLVALNAHVEQKTT